MIAHLRASSAGQLLHRPHRECAGKAFHGHAIVPLPCEMPMLHSPEPVDILFGPITEPDLCAFDASHHTGGEVNCAAKHIAFLNWHRTDVNSGTNLNLGMTRVLLKGQRVVQR